MRNAIRFIGCFAVLAAPLAFGLPAYGQQAPAPAIPSPGAANGARTDEPMERRELREEREKIRAEHEALETQREQLRASCMDAKGQDRSTCDAKMKDLHQKMAALHERMKALHQQVEAEHAQNGQGNWHGPQANKSQGTPASGTPAAQPSTPVPAGQ